MLEDSARVGVHNLFWVGLKRSNEQIAFIGRLFVDSETRKSNAIVGQ